VVQVVLRALMAETDQVLLLPTLDQQPRLELALVVKVLAEQMIKQIFRAMVVQIICIPEAPVTGMVVVVVPVVAVMDQTVSTSAVRVVPVELAVPEFQVQFAAARNFLVVAVAVVERHHKTRVRQMVLVAQVEVALADPVAAVQVSCQQQVRQTRVLVAVEAVGEIQILMHNELALRAQTELLYFRIQRQQRVFQAFQ
jgi:hypothetical protein